MRNLILFLVLATAAFAQAPSDTLVTKLAERDTPEKKFLRDNPGATEVTRNENATHYKKVDGTYTAVFGGILNYVDANSQFQPVAPELWQTDAGFRQIGTPSPIRIVTTNRNQDTIEIWNGTRVATATTPKLTKIGDWTWTFPWEMITWTLEVQNSGWQVTSQPIATARGSRAYQMPLASTGLNPVPDADGDLVDGTFKLTRAVMVRADGVKTPCSAWTVSSKSVDFTCDDTGFPAAAFPYVIDPTATFTLSNSENNFYGSYEVVITESGWCHSPDDTWLGSFYYGDMYASYRCNCDASNCYTTQNRVMMDFKTSSLPAGAIVSSASVSVYTQVNAFRWAGPPPIEFRISYVACNTDYAVNCSTTPGATAYSNVGTDWGQYVWITFPLSNVSGNVKNPYTGLMLRAAGTTAGSYYQWGGDFDRYTNMPYLTVNYTVNNAPTTVSATPHSGTLYTGIWNTFTFQVADADGYANLDYYHLLLSYGVDGLNACYLLVYPNANTVYLLNDASNNWGAGATFGAASFLENSQCKIDVANSSRTNSGNNSTAAVKIQLKPTFNYGGWTKHSYVYVRDLAVAEAGWTDYGSWTLVPGGPKMISISQ